MLALIWQKPNSLEIFSVRNPYRCFAWLSQGEGTALESLKPQAVDKSPENQFTIVSLILSLSIASRDPPGVLDIPRRGYYNTCFLSHEFQMQ